MKNTDHEATIDYSAQENHANPDGSDSVRGEKPYSDLEYRPLPNQPQIDDFVRNGKNYRYDNPGYNNNNPKPNYPGPGPGYQTPPPKQENNPWGYIPEDKKTSSANPVMVFGILSGIIIGLVLIVGILIGRLSGGSDDKKKAGTGGDGKATTAQAPATTETEAQNTQTTKTPSTVIPNPQNPTSLVLSDQLEDYTFSLEGTVYQLPCDFSVFSNNGWSVSPYSTSKETDDVPGEKNIFFTFTNQTGSVTTEAYNPTGNVCMLKECKIVGVTVNASSGLDFKIAGGISPLVSKDELQNKFGAPTRSYSANDYESLYYNTDQNNSKAVTSFTVYKNADKRKYNSISLRNNNCPVETETAASGETPDYLAQYRQPSSINTGKIEPVFKLDGKLYQLPCPLKEFTDAGWEIKNIKSKTVSGMNEESSAISIQKGEAEINLDMFNFMKGRMNAEDCAVSGISLTNIKSTYTNPFPSGMIEFSGGLKPEMSSSDFLKVISSGGWDKYDNKTDKYTAISGYYNNDDYTFSLHGSWMDYKDGSYYRSLSMSNKIWSY